MVRFELEGPCPIASQLRSGEALADLDLLLVDRLQLLGVEVRASRVTLPVDVAEHRGAPHVLGMALDLLAEAISDPRAAEALAPRLAGAPTDEAERAAYLRGLLDGLDVEIAAAMVRERNQ